MELGMTFYGIAYVIALVIPGIFFKRFYYQGRFAKQFTQGLFADRLITNIFWSGIIQVITVFLFCSYYEISYEDVIKELDTIYGKIVKNELPRIQFEYITHTIQYLGFSIIVAIALGIVLHLFVRYLKLDIKLSILRFSNHWHYYFSGDILKTREFRKEKGKPGFIISTDIDVVVKDNDGRTNMFTGTLSQYTLTRTGELETVFLTNTKRWKIPSASATSKSTKSTTSIIKEIPGDCFIIPYSNILNMNVRYNFLAGGPEVKNKAIWGVFYTGIMLITFLLFFVAAVYPWVAADGFVNKLIAFLLFFVAWTSLMALSLSLDPNAKKENKLDPKAKVIVFVIFLVLLIGGLSVTGDLDISYIFKIFK